MSTVYIHVGSIPYIKEKNCLVPGQDASANTRPFQILDPLTHPRPWRQTRSFRAGMEGLEGGVTLHDTWQCDGCPVDRLGVMSAALATTGQTLSCGRSVGAGQEERWRSPGVEEGQVGWTQTAIRRKEARRAQDLKREAKGPTKEGNCIKGRSKTGKGGNESERHLVTTTSVWPGRGGTGCV